MSQQTRERVVNLLNRIPVNLAVIILCLIWLLPTLGLLVTSFRPPKAVNESGWWTALSNNAPTADTYSQLCAGCHGDNFTQVESVSLANEDLLTEWTTGARLRRSVLQGHDDLENMPATSMPPELDDAEAADILDYLRYEAGIVDVERFTLANYEDVLVGFTTPGSSYEESCETDGPSA